MKKMLITAGLAAAMVTGQAQTANAMNEEWAAVAGFVGGVLLANAASCNTPTVRYYEPARVEYRHYEPPRRIARCDAQPRGRYEYRTERVWVPGYWTYDSDCGGRRQVWQPGYYETTRSKVWVSHQSRYDY